jgi:hypothetical protein
MPSAFVLCHTQVKVDMQQGHNAQCRLLQPFLKLLHMIRQFLSTFLYYSRSIYDCFMHGPLSHSELITHNVKPILLSPNTRKRLNFVRGMHYR